jgi:hypothetical protein
MVWRSVTRAEGGSTLLQGCPVSYKPRGAKQMSNEHRFRREFTRSRPGDTVTRGDAPSWLSDQTATESSLARVFWHFQKIYRVIALYKHKDLEILILLWTHGNQLYADPRESSVPHSISSSSSITSPTSRVSASMFISTSSSTSSMSSASCSSTSSSGSSSG